MRAVSSPSKGKRKVQCTEDQKIPICPPSCRKVSPRVCHQTTPPPLNPKTSCLCRRRRPLETLNRSIDFIPEAIPNSPFPKLGFLGL
ncbi:hypothetical protein AKJ16_DCAP07695 [Drosera capensis]